MAIGDHPTTISTDDYTVDVTVSAPQGTSYIRLDLFKESTTNHYFGETYNGSEWYGGSDGTRYLALNISETKIATISVTGRVGEPDNSDYPGPGQYKLKARRYTSPGSYLWGDPVTVELTKPLPTPNPSPQPTPHVSPSPAATPSVTPPPSAATPFRISSPRTNPTPKKEVAATAEFKEVLGETTVSVIPSSSTQVLSASKSAESGSKRPVGLLLIIFGALLSGVAGFLFYRIWGEHQVKSGREESHT